MQKVLGLFLHKHPARQTPDSDWTAQQVTKAAYNQSSAPTQKLWMNAAMQQVSAEIKQTEEKTNQHHKTQKKKPLTTLLVKRFPAGLFGFVWGLVSVCFGVWFCFLSRGFPNSKHSLSLECSDMQSNHSLTVA